jgi:NAD(P)-dependent dehydrogenase (short-subunit alcohol dehydrogenase family)
MQDRVVVITGGSAGIGAALAEQLAKKGAKPVLVARRTKELREVAARAGDAQIIVADVTVRADVERARDEALARHGRIDAWVNNAGRGITRLPSQLTDDDLDDMMRVNVKSALYGMQAALAVFEKQGRDGNGEGHVINVSSMLGRVPFALVRAAYCAAKHALNSLTASFRMELRERLPGVHVSLVHPGVVATDFGLNALHGGFDSRNFPGAQSADEVAAVIVDVLERPRADVYTRPGAQKLVVGYYAAEDMGLAETRPPFGFPAKP